MSDAVVGYELIDDVIANYVDIFTSELGNEIGDRPKQGSKLRDITNNLLINWRSAAYVAGMPPEYAKGIGASLQVYAKTPTGNTELLNLADGMLSRITAKVPDLFADPPQRRAVHTALVNFS